MDASGLTSWEEEIQPPRRSTILPPPLRSEVAELDLELIAAYARTSEPPPEAVDSWSSLPPVDTDVAPDSDAAPTTVLPPRPPPALGLGFWAL